MNTPRLADFHRIVVKVGSSLLVDAQAGKLNEHWLPSLAADIAALHRDKRDILVVSSGAIALGRTVLKLPAGALKLEDSQAAAAGGPGPPGPAPRPGRRGEAGGQSGGWGGRPDRAGAHLDRGAVAAWHHCRPGAGDARRHRRAAA